MGLLSWLWRDPEALGEAEISPALVAEATDLVVRLTNPRLTLVSRYRQRLGPAIETSIRFLRSQIPLLPASREATRAAWSSDPAIHAYFATADDVPKICSRSNELREFFDKNPEVQDVNAVLGMQMTQQRVMGLALEGEVLRRDVPQTTVSFSDHRIRIFGTSEQALRREVGVRIFEQLALIALARISGIQTRIKELHFNRALLKTRLKVLDQQGVGLTALAGEGAEESDLNKVRARMEENERELGSVPTGTDVLEHDLEIVRDIFSAPGDSIQLSTRRLCLTPLNVLVEGEVAGPGQDVDVGLVSFAATPPIERAFALVRFPRSELLPGGMRLADAERLL